jgi:hypothetical protein
MVIIFSYKNKSKAICTYPASSYFCSRKVIEVLNLAEAMLYLGIKAFD